MKPIAARRIFNPQKRDGKHYTNISIAAEWLGDGGFEKFLAHIGSRPSSRHSIDRYPDPTGNYEPGNVRWATLDQQARNKRNNWLILIGGEWVNAKDASRILKVPYSSLVNACRGVQDFPKAWPFSVIFKRATREA